MSKIDAILKQRREFLKYLTSDLEKCDEIIAEASQIMTKHEETLENVKFLSGKVEHASLIPLGRNIYVNGVIKHTGEYFLNKKSHPESYTVVETADRTLTFLQDKIRQQSDVLAQAERNKEQIKERFEVLGGTPSSEDKTDLSTSEIASEKGVAIKVGEFYEILEFED